MRPLVQEFPNKSTSTEMVWCPKDNAHQLLGDIWIPWRSVEHGSAWIAFFHILFIFFPYLAVSFSYWTLRRPWLFKSVVSCCIVARQIASGYRRKTFLSTWWSKVSAGPFPWRLGSWCVPSWMAPLPWCKRSTSTIPNACAGPCWMPHEINGASGSWLCKLAASRSHHCFGPWGALERSGYILQFDYKSFKVNPASGFWTYIITISYMTCKVLYRHLRLMWDLQILPIRPNVLSVWERPCPTRAVFGCGHPLFQDGKIHTTFTQLEEWCSYHSQSHDWRCADYPSWQWPGSGSEDPCLSQCIPWSIDPCIQCLLCILCIYYDLLCAYVITADFGVKYLQHHADMPTFSKVLVFFVLFSCGMGRVLCTSTYVQFSWSSESNMAWYSAERRQLLLRCRWVVQVPAQHCGQHPARSPVLGWVVAGSLGLFKVFSIFPMDNPPLFGEYMGK